MSWEESPGARELRAERERLIAERDQALAEVERLRERCDSLQRASHQRVALLQAERDRLRAVLAAVVEVSDSESATMDTNFEVLEMARSVLADTARAGMEPTPAEDDDPEEGFRLDDAEVRR